MLGSLATGTIDPGGCDPEGPAAAMPEAPTFTNASFKCKCKVDSFWMLSSFTNSSPLNPFDAQDLVEVLACRRLRRRGTHDGPSTPFWGRVPPGRF